MSNPFDQFDSSDSSANPFDQFDAGTKPAAKKQNKGIAGDIVTDLKRGVEQLPGIATGIADIPIAAVTGQPYASKAADALGEATGFQPSKWAKDAQAEYSTGRQEAAANVDKVWEQNQTPFADAAKGNFSGIGQIAKSYIDNPQQLVGSVAESLPSMVAGGIAGRAAMGVGARSVSAAAGGVGAELPGALTRFVGEKAAPVIAGSGGEGAVMAGQQMDQLTQAGADPRTAAAAAAATGIAGGAIGALGGKVAQRMGIVDPDTAMAGGALRATTTEAQDQTIKGMVKEGAKRVAGGAMSEGFFEELPQSVLEQTLSNLAQGKPWDEGVARSAVEGTLAGSLMGGAFNVMPPKQEAAPGAEQPPVADNVRFPDGVTLTTNPEPIQQRIDALMGINQERLSDQSRSDYEKAVANAFGEQIGITQDANGLEIPYTMGDYLNSQVRSEDESRARPLRQQASQEADARLQQIADEEQAQQPDISPAARGIAAPPVIPVVGPLSAAANLAVQSGAHHATVMQQAAGVKSNLIQTEESNANKPNGLSSEGNASEQQSANAVSSVETASQTAINRRGEISGNEVSFAKNDQRGRSDVQSSGLSKPMESAKVQSREEDKLHGADRTGPRVSPTSNSLTAYAKMQGGVAQETRNGKETDLSGSVAEAANYAKTSDSPSAYLGKQSGGVQIDNPAPANTDAIAPAESANPDQKKADSETVPALNAGNSVNLPATSISSLQDQLNKPGAVKDAAPAADSNGFVHGQNGYKTRIAQHKAGSNLLDPTADVGAFTYEVRKGDNDPNPMNMAINKDGNLVPTSRVLGKDGKSNGTAWVPANQEDAEKVRILLGQRAKTEIGSTERKAIDAQIKEVVTGNSNGGTGSMEPANQNTIKNEKPTAATVPAETAAPKQGAENKEPNLEAAKALIQEAKDTHGDKRKEAIVRKKARELAQKTPLSDEKTVLALDMVSTRLGMGDGGTKALEFLPAVENAQKPVGGADENQAADEQDAGGDAEKLGDTKSYSEVEQKLINGEINVEDFMSATGLTDDDVGFLTGSDLRQQADVAAKENSPYFSGIRKLSAAIFKEIEGLSRGTTAQSRRAYDANLAKYKAAQDTLEVIAKNFEHPFRNTLLSKLPPFLESRYGKQWDGVEYGDKAKKSYHSDSYSRWVDLLIDAARKTADTADAKIDKSDDWLAELFGDPQSAEDKAINESQLAQQAQDKADRVDSAIAMLTGEIEASNAAAAEVAARNYKSNRKQIELKGDGPGKNGSLSISAINESRKRRTVEALQNASSSIKQAIEFIAENPDAAFKQVADMEAAVTKQFNEGFFGPSAKLDGQLDMAVGSLIGSGSYSGEGSAGRKLRMAAHAYASADAVSQPKTDAAPEAKQDKAPVSTLQPDPALQNRDRGRAASVNQMQSIARNPDYMRLGPSRTPDSGAPMVFAVGNDTQKIAPANFGANDTAVMSDGQRVPFRYAVVDANQVQPSNFADGATNPEFASTNQGTIKALNNGRTAGVRSAHSSGNAATYTAELLADNAHGVSPEAIRNTPNPMLVRVYAEQSNTGDMAAKSQGQGLGMSASERATQDSELMSSDVLDKFAPGDIASAGNRDFVRSFVGKLAANDVADLMDATGNLSQDGRRRIEAALLTAAYGKSDLVQELFESTDTDIKAIGNALKVMSGQWAAMRNAAKEGSIDPATDMTANLIEAVNIVRRSRAEGSSIAELAGQGDLMGGNYLNELSELFLRIFYKGKNYDRARGGDKVIAALQEVVTSAMNTKAEAGLFGDSFKATPKQIVESARSKIDEENKPASQSSLFGANGQATAVSQGNRSEGAAQPGEVGQRPVGAGRSEETGKQAEPVERSISDLQKELESARFGERTELNGILVERVSEDAEQAIKQGEMPMYQTGQGTFVALHPSAQQDGMIQATRYSDTGVFGDSQYKEVKEAVRDNGLWFKRRLPDAEAARLLEQSIAAEAEYQERKNGASEPVAAAEEVNEFSLESFESWKRQGMNRGTASGWTIFFDHIYNGFKLARKTKGRNAAGGGYVGAEIVTKLFDSLESANVWAKSKPAKAAEQAPAVEANGDLRGYAYALVKNGQILISGSFPSPKYMEADESSSVTKWQKEADRLGADLYIGGYPGADTFEPQDGLIFGMTFDEIAAKQNKRTIPASINRKMPKDAVLAYEAQAKPATVDAKKQEEAKPVADNEPTEAGRGPRQYNTMADIDSAIEGIYDGTVSLTDYKAAFNGLLASKDAITAELGKMTIPQLHERFGKQPYGRPEKKGEIVERAFEAVRNVFALRRSYGRNSYTMGRGEYEKYLADNIKALTDLVNSSTADDLKKFADEIGNTRAARQEKIAAAQDPKTIEDFDNALRLKKSEGMTFAEARMSLTPEQRAEYDRLKGVESRNQRKARADQQNTDVRVAAQTAEGQVVETKHTKTGEPLFVVKAAERVDRDVYTLWNATAKRMGGHYSSFRGNGAVPGFQFKTRDNADAFLAFIGGNAEAAKDAVQERRDAFADDRSQSAVERLNEMAERMEEKADESLSRERKANTERRSRFAASAEAAANAEKAMAKTMRRIAEAISNGTAQFLDRVRQKAQIEYLTSVLRTAKDTELRTKYPSYADQERHKGEPATGETADYADFPQYAMMRSDLANLARKMVTLPNMKLLGQRILKVADDTSDAYNAFAKEHLLEVSRFGKADGSGWATFSTLKDAERSIDVSSLSSVAVPLQIKRGEYRIVLSPSEAINRGIWKGDDRKMYMSADIGEEIVEKLGKLNRKSGNRRGMDAPPEAPWQFENAYNSRKRLAVMGIEQPWEFRAALREFADLKEAPTEADKIKAMERAMIGRKNDGLDFFPTPADTAQAMIDAAEITEGMSVLEPSAGMGHIAEQVRNVAGIDPDVIEFNSDRRELLEAKGFNVVGNDFMDLTPRSFTYGDVFVDKAGVEGIMRGSGGMGSNRVGFVPLGKDERMSEWRDRDELTGVRKSGYNSGYDRIIMNPPFSNRRDAEHVQHAYSLLKPGGRIVAIMGEGVFFGQDKKAIAFREWLDEVGGTSEKLEEGTFLDPSLPVNTSTNARMVVIDKPAGDVSPNATDSDGVAGNIAAPSTISPADKAIYGMAAEGKSAADILKFIASSSRNPFYRQLAKLLMKTGIAPSITVGDGKGWKFNAGEGNKYAAGYNPKSNTISLFRPASAERNMLHELTHAATLKALSGKGMAAAQMKALYQHVKKSGKLKGMYGMSDVDEFIAEAFSNPKFQEQLKKVAAPKASAGTLSSAWNWFVRIVRGILGVSANEENALAQALEIGVDVMRENMGAATPNTQTGYAGARSSKMQERPSVRAVTGSMAEPAQLKVGDGGSGNAIAIPDAVQASAIKAAQKVQDESNSFDLEEEINSVSENGEADLSSLIANPKYWDAENEEFTDEGYKQVDLLNEQKARDNLRLLSITELSDLDSAYHKAQYAAMVSILDGIGIPYKDTSSNSSKYLEVGRLKLRFSNHANTTRSVMAQVSNMDEVTSLINVAPGEYKFSEAIDAVMREMSSAGSGAIRYNAAPGKINQTDTEAFKRWFGDSKVVDADGKPMRVYHGTGATDIGAFNVSDRGSYGGGIYLTPEIRGANDYAIYRGAPSSTVYPVYAAIKNPASGSEAAQVASWKGEENAREELIRRGYDGVVDMRSGEIVAFYPSQVKSAIGNNGDFDGGNPDIRYNVADEGWSVTEPSKMDDVIYALQDKQIDMKRIMQSIMKTGKQIRDNLNPYLQEELFHGRAAKGVKDFLDFELRPLLKQMQDAKVDMGDFEEYLWNRHAEERNAQIAKINKDMPDGGSGIETAAARAYLAGLPAERRRAFESMAAKVDTMNRNSQRVLVESGLEKQSTIDAWNGAYKHYVPLQREDVDTGHVGTGKGFSVRGSSTKRAMGSGKAVVDIIANLTMQRERNIVRAEKNRVSNALLGLAIENPNPEFWKVDQAPKERVVEETAIYTVLDANGKKIDEFTRMSDAERLANKTPGSTIDQSWGDRVNERITPGFKNRDNVILTRINGEDHYIILNERDERAMRLSASMKNLDMDNMGRALSIVGKATRYLASVNTQYNPVFGVINLIRDVQGALLNLQSTQLAGEQKRVAGYTVDALRGIYADIRAHRAGKVPSSNWAKLFEEFQKEGGQTGYRDQYANAEARAEAIVSELKQFNEGKPKRMARAVFSWLSDYNETMENAVRLAAYKTAKEKGLSNQQAASIAKNLTVNFNRKGQMTTQIGALYAFFNASVQGTARLAETLFEKNDGDPKKIRLSKLGKQIITGGIMLGSMQALLLAAAGFDDDEPPEFIRERNLILPIGDGKYLTLAMPLGFHVIPGIGRIATEFALSGFKDPAKRTVSMLGMFAETFNPIGSAGLSIQTLTPSVVDPFAALAENRDFTGREIYRENFNANDPSPGHARAKDVATVWSRYISEAINFVTGGTEFKPGAFSPSPDAIDYLIAQATGGVGREVNKVGQTAGAAYTGDDLPLYKIPLVGRFIGDTEGQSGHSQKFYNAVREINLHEREIKGLREAGRIDEAREYMAENPVYRMSMMANSTERQVRKLRDVRRAASESGDADKVREINDQITNLMSRFNERTAPLLEQ